MCNVQQYEDKEIYNQEMGFMGNETKIEVELEACGVQGQSKPQGSRRRVRKQDRT
jgi:hypothetical protein